MQCIISYAAGAAVQPTIVTAIIFIILYKGCFPLVICAHYGRFDGSISITILPVCYILGKVLACVTYANLRPLRPSVYETWFRRHLSTKEVLFSCFQFIRGFMTPL